MSKSASFSRQSSAPDLFTPEMEANRAEALGSASWKEEVNQRLAAHRSRRATGAEEQHRGLANPQQSANSRAAQAAARVAARYAQAPSYSELLAGEARAVVHAASAAVEAARDAQAAAQAVLAGLQYRLPEVAAPTKKYGNPAEHAYAPNPAAKPARWQDAPPSAPEDAATQVAAMPRWEEALPTAAAAEPDVWEEMRVYPAPAFQSAPEYEFSRATYAEDLFPEDVMASATVEPVQSTTANLIEFPRELIAARKARPRLAEGPFAQSASQNPQLSIFEVDPAMLAAPVQIHVAPPEWATIELDEPELRMDERAAYRTANPQDKSDSRLEPMVELGPLDHHNFFEADPGAFEDDPTVASTTDWNDPAPSQAYRYEAGYANTQYSNAAAASRAAVTRAVATDFDPFEPLTESPDLSAQTIAATALPPAVQPPVTTAVAGKAELFVAAKSDRLLASIVDGALVTLAYLAAATVVIASTDHPPSGIVALEATAIGLVLFSILYLAIFFGFSAEGTPGMRYARIALCTFDDNNPTVTQSLRRIPALLLAALPAGLGLAWAIVDSNGLGMHDRLSKTYQRKY